MAGRRQMSLEAALDEEAKDIMALLEGKKRQPSDFHPTTRRTASPAGVRQSKSPVRSMLDIAPGVPRSQILPAKRAASIASDGRNSALNSPTGSTFSEPAPIRSMLDFNSPPPSAGLPRSHRASHGSTSPGLPTIHQGLASPKSNIESTYQFGMPPSVESHAMPKRVSQGGKKKGGNAMSTVFGSAPESRQSQYKRNKSRSPAPLHVARSQSPANRLKPNSPNLKSTPGTYVSDSGKVIDLNSAYRRLSDAALLKSGGRLADLPTNKRVNAERGEELAPDGGVRLTKDYDEEEAVDSSDEEESAGSSGDERDAEERGRARARKGSDVSPSSSPPPQPKTLLGAMEEERKQVHKELQRQGKTMSDAPDAAAFATTLKGKNVSTKKKSRSMLAADDGPLTADHFLSRKRANIHPRTSFDDRTSGISTPVDSDEEQARSDFNTAQKMALTLSPIHSSPEAHRCIRQILRGDFRKYQMEAEQGLRRQRMYLVATDLSEEAAYALEWTIGTVLRDGDTLLAVYAVDEEAGTGGDPSASVNTSVGIGEGSNQMKEAAAIVRTLSKQQGLVVPGEVWGKASTDGRSPSHVRTMSLSGYKDKAESARHYATEEITERCIKLLRKTKLQVRVVVEVFHCKSPKHMITEVIDYLEPTLVILGSRGRSALKGVLLGSFSNYLVTKSSVPVMVARKKLRKHSKGKGPGSRLSNMLETPGGRLASAVIDRPSIGMRRNSGS